MLKRRKHHLNWTNNSDAAAVGLVLLSTDFTAERDFATICPPGSIAAYANRIAYDNPTTPENLAATLPRLTEAARNILPAQPLAAIIFGCTSASAILGEEVATNLAAGRPGTPCVTPVSAAHAAFEHLGVNRISMLTPYTPVVTEPVVSWFAAHGIQVGRVRCFGLEDDMVMARISRKAIIEAAKATIEDDAQALFISCTALRSASVAEHIEQIIGKPVVTSNQAMVWRSLRLAGYAQAVPGYGRLLSS